jgi:hypothetical protein
VVWCGNVTRRFLQLLNSLFRRANEYSHISTNEDMYAVIPASDIVQDPTKEGFSLKHPGFTPDHYLAHKRKVPLNDISTKRNSLQPEGTEMKNKKKIDRVDDKMSSSNSRNSVMNTGGGAAAVAVAGVVTIAAADRARQSKVIGSGLVPSARYSQGGGQTSATACNSASHSNGSNHRRTDLSRFNDDTVDNSDSSDRDNDSDSDNHGDGDSDSNSGDSRRRGGMVQDKGTGKGQEKGKGNVRQGARTSISTISSKSRVSLSVSKHIPTSTAQRGARNNGSGSESDSDSDVDSSNSASTHSERNLTASRQLTSSKKKKDGSSSRGECNHRDIDRDSEGKGKGSNVRRSNGSSSAAATKHSRPASFSSTSTSASKSKSQSKPVSSSGAGAGANIAVDAVRSSKSKSQSQSVRMAGLDTQHAVSLNRNKSKSSASVKAGNADSIQMKKSATTAKNVVRKSKETNKGKEKEKGKEKMTVLGAGRGNVKGQGRDDAGCASDFHRICLGMHLTDYSPGKNYFPISYHTNGQEYGFTDYDRSKSKGDEDDDSQSNEYDTDEPIFIERVEKLEDRKVFDLDEENYFFDYEDDKTEMEFESDAGPETVEAECSSSDDDDKDESEGKGKGKVGGDVRSVQVQINGADRGDVRKLGGDTRNDDYEDRSRTDSGSGSGSGSCVDLTGGHDSQKQKQKTGESVEDGSDEDDEIMSVHSSICDDNDSYNCDYSDKGDDQDDGDDDLHSVHSSVDSIQHTPPPQQRTPNAQYHTSPPHHHTPHARHHTPPPHCSTEHSHPLGTYRASLSRAAKIPECNYGSTSDDDSEGSDDNANNENIENNGKIDKIEDDNICDASAVERLAKSPSSVSTSPSCESIVRERGREKAIRDDDAVSLRETHSRVDDDDRILGLHPENMSIHSADENEHDGDESSSQCDGNPLKAEVIVNEKEKNEGHSRDGETDRCARREGGVGVISRDGRDVGGEEVATAVDRTAPLCSPPSAAIKRSHRDSSKSQKDKCKRIYIDISDSESVTDQITRIDFKAKKISKKMLALISKEEKKKTKSGPKKKVQAPEDFTNFSKIILKNIPRPEAPFIALYEGVQRLYLDEGMESVRYFAGHIEDRSAHCCTVPCCTVPCCAAQCCLFLSTDLLNRTHIVKS